MSQRALIMLMAGLLAGMPVLGKDKDEQPDATVVATVNGEPVTKNEWKTIMDADKWHGPTMKAEPAFSDRMAGKPFEDFFFTEEVVKIRVMAQKYKDSLPQMKAAIEAVHQKAKAGEDFAELAKQFSQDATAAEGGSLGKKELHQMTFPFNRIMLATKAGEISEPLMTIHGYHILKVDRVHPAAEGKGKSVEVRHILIKFPSQNAKAESDTLASQAKVEVLDKGLCKKLVSYCSQG